MILVGIDLFDWLDDRTPPVIVWGSIVSSAFAIAAVTLASVSVTLGQLSALIGASLLGAAIVDGWTSLPERWTQLRAVIPRTVFLLVAAAYMGAIEPDPPLFGMLLLPIAPLSLLLIPSPGTAGPPTYAHMGIQLAIVTCVLAFLCFWIVGPTLVSR
jgi:hypothetical protein